MIGTLTCLAVMVQGQQPLPEPTMERIRKMGLEVTFSTQPEWLGGKGTVKANGRVYDYSIGTGCCHYFPVITLTRRYQMAKPVDTKTFAAWADGKEVPSTLRLDNSVTFKLQVSGFKEDEFKKTMESFERVNKDFERFLGKAYYYVEIRNGASDRPIKKGVKIDPIRDDSTVTTVDAEDVQALAKLWGWKPLGIYNMGFAESLVEVAGTPLSVISDPGLIGVYVFLREGHPAQEKVKELSVFADLYGTSRGMTAGAHLVSKEGLPLKEFRRQVEMIAKGLKPWAIPHPSMAKQ